MKTEYLLIVFYNMINQEEESLHFAINLRINKAILNRKFEDVKFMK